MRNLDQLARRKSGVNAEPSGGGRGSANPRTDVGRRVLFDAVLLGLAALAAALAAAAAGTPQAPLGWRLVYVGVTLLMLGASGAYRPRFSAPLLEDFRDILGAAAVAAMAVTFVRVLGGDDADAAAQAARLWVFATMYMGAGRVGYTMTRRRDLRLGGRGKRTLIIGAGQIGSLLAARLLERRDFGLQPVAFLDPSPLLDGGGVDLPVLDPTDGSGDLSTWTSEQLEQLLADWEIEHLIVAFSREPHEQKIDLMRLCADRGISVSVVPRLFEGISDQARVDRIGGVPLVTVYPSHPKSLGFAVKYAIDRILALLALILLSPLLVVVALSTLVTVGAPVLFRQERVGMDGQRFELLKFRTMHAGPGDFDPVLGGAAGRTLGPGGIEQGDRRSSLGRVLRRTAVDELPQLVNVLKGEMSLVGPRPERVRYVELFSREIKHYSRRTRVRSGLTGWAQVHGLRGKTSIEDRVEWDNYYVENWSFWLDIKIIVMTLRALLRDQVE